jgi:metallophosphoesterase (TIGR00282 family)
LGVKVKILFFGDVVGRPGRQAIRDFLQRQKLNDYDLIIANGENSAGGNGITRPIAEELYSLGIDCITLGNHTWDKKEILSFINTERRIVRPANYPPGTPGKGYTILHGRNGGKIAVVNLTGRIFLSNLDCPFRTAEQLTNDIKKVTNQIIVDFHAEATSEKIALGWFMDGKVSAVLGTHTHVQTNDYRVLPKGTAFITDVGMTGPRDSVLGVKPKLIIQRFLTQMPVKFEVAHGVIQINAVMLELDKDGKAKEIKVINEFLE